MNPSHHNELKASGISNEIIDLYFTSVEGDEAQDYLIGDRVAQLRDKRDNLPGHAQQYATAPVIKLNKQIERLYEQSEHVRGGGWLCSANGQIKPDSPRQAIALHKESGEYRATDKIIKYEAIREKSYQGSHVSLISPITEPIKAADGSRLIVITEGGKKAAAAATIGYESVGLPGVDMGSFGDGQLIPVLAELAAEGCTFAIAYDQDSRKATRRGVAGSLARLAALLPNAVVPVWSPKKDGKGLDDVLVKRGAGFVHAAIADAKSFADWKKSLPEYWFRAARPAGYSAELQRIEKMHKAFIAKPKADTVLNQRYLDRGSLTTPGSASLMDSPRSTGKTSSYLSGVMDEWRSKHPGAIAISLGSRNILLRQSGAALGFIHWLDTDGHPSLAKFRCIATCIDSLVKLANQPIPPGSLIIMDEFVALLRHLYTSDTMKNGADRVIALRAIITVSKRVIDGGGYIIGLEADIPQWAVDCLKELLPAGTPLSLTRNEFKLKAGEKVYFYPSLASLKAEQQSMVDGGVRVVAASDSATQIDLQHREMFNTDADFHISAQNSSEPDAQLFAENPQAFLTKNGIPWCRYLSYSPTIGAGTSIDDAKGHSPLFDVKAGIFTHLTSSDAAQQIARYRRPVPIHIYCQERGTGIGDKDLSIFDPEKLQEKWRSEAKYCHQLVDIAEYLSEQAGGNLVKTLERSLSGEVPEVASINKWRSIITAVDNFDKLHLKENLKQRLEADGYEVVEIEEVEVTPEKKTELKDLKKQAECKSGSEFAAVEVPETMAPNEARDILSTHGHSRTETLQAKKCLYQFEFPGCDFDNADFCTEWLIKSKGKKLAQLRTEWAARNPKQAKAIDRWHLKSKLKQAYNLNTGVSMADVSQMSPAADVFAKAGLTRAIDAIGTEMYNNDHPEVVRVAKWVNNHQPLLKRVFRMRFDSERSNVGIFNSFARKLGYQPEKEKKKGKKGQQERQYILSDFTNPDRGHMLKSLSDKFTAKLEQKGEALDGKSLETTNRWGVNAETLQKRQTAIQAKQASLANDDADDWEPFDEMPESIKTEAPRVKPINIAKPETALYPSDIPGDLLAFYFQDDMCKATTYAQLLEAKAKTPKATQLRVMRVWAEDGRRDALIAKRDRLRKEALKNE